MLAELLEQVDKLKAQLDAVRPLSVEDAQRLRAKLNLEWTYHSNAIEGNTLTLGETRAFLYHGLTARGKPFKDYLDIKGHKAAIEHVEAIVREEHPLTEADIRELHRLLLVEPYEMDARTPDGQPTKRMIQIGEYKLMPNSVRTQTGELHTYASPEETPALMGDLMRWYRKESENEAVHPVVLAALFHYRFVAIHPFDDGNGRMTRILMNLVLMRSSYVPVVIRNDQRDNYLLALSQADAGETEPFVEFIAELEIEQLELTLKAASGESIDELDDLDKRLSLLQQQLQSRHNQAQHQQRKKLEPLTSEFLLPFLEKLSIQLPKFDLFFRGGSGSISSVMPQSVDMRDQVEYASQFVEKTKHLLHDSSNACRIFLNYNLREFKDSRKESIYIVIEFDFCSDEIFLCKWVIDNDILSIQLTKGSRYPHTLVEALYDELNFSDEEIDTKVKIITDEIYRRIEEFSGLNT